MIKFWKRRASQKVLTEKVEQNRELNALRRELKENIHKKFAGSLAIRMVDSGSCNACEAECNALSNPYYDLDRLGIYFVASPRHADVMLVSGVVTFNMYHHLLDCYEQMAEPKWVIALGDCPLMESSSFKESFAIKGIKSTNLKIDYLIKGCPPSPDEIIKGLLEFLEKI